jgi:hypothetical protein
MLGIIGGSGVYDVDGLTHTRWMTVASPFGTPSDDVLIGELDGHPIAFLPRHGRGHRIPPSAIDFRANIDALKRVGVTEIVSVSAVGSLREHLAPGLFVIVDQFIDRTFARAKTFFDAGVVAHVSMARPVCRRLGDTLEEAAKAAAIPHARGGTYLVMEGPQFSSLAEGETRARGGDLLCDRRDGDGLRLLASATRRCHDRHDRSHRRIERRPGALAAEGRRAPHCGIPRTVPAGMSRSARTCDHHRARSGRVLRRATT